MVEFHVKIVPSYGTTPLHDLAVGAPFTTAGSGGVYLKGKRLKDTLIETVQLVPEVRVTKMVAGERVVALVQTAPAEFRPVGGNEQAC